MSKITVNNEIILDGAFSFNVTLNENVRPAVVTISGVAKLDTYVEDIDSLKSDKFELSGIHVFQEAFGSEEDTYVYSFTAKNYKILGANKNG